MRSKLDRIRRMLSPRVRRDRQNVRALAAHLQVPESLADRLYRRSREVGYPTALEELGLTDTATGEDPRQPPE